MNYKSIKTMLAELTEYDGVKFSVSRGWLIIDRKRITQDIESRLFILMRERGLTYLKD